jgi:hypothetical protein
VVGLPDGRAFVSGYYYTGAPNAGGNNGSNRLVTWSGIYDLTEGVVQLTQGPRGYLPQATSLSDGRVFLWGGGIGWTDDDRGSEMDPAWGDILE